MSDFVFNIAKGRAAELFRKVAQNDPGTSTLVIGVLATSGLEADSVLIDKDDFSALVAGSTNWVTNTGYTRKTLTDSNITYAGPDDTNDRMDCDIPDLTWSSISAGDGWSKIVIGYDDNAGADSAIVPLTAHDFISVPDGSDITAQIATAGFYRAS